MSKCPKCGAELGGTLFKVTPYDSTSKITDLLSTRSTPLRKLFKRLHKEISRSIPSDADKISFMKFLERIQGIEEEKLIWGINLYLSGQYRFEGKGYNYLFGIINRHNLDRNKLKEYEKMRYGTPPPIVKIKGEKE